MGPAGVINRNDSFDLQAGRRRQSRGILLADMMRNEPAVSDNHRPMIAYGAYYASSSLEASDVCSSEKLSRIGLPQSSDAGRLFLSVLFFEQAAMERLLLSLEG